MTKPRQRWGVCKCWKWGEAPATFNESKHFLVCECGAKMSLTIFDPRDAAYPERDHITPTLMLQDEEP